jgi:hypothetical protein
MTPKELLEFFRSQSHDEKTPYLWSDTEVLRYMNIAYVDWVREIGGLRDQTSELTQLVLPATVSVVDLDERIVKILSARITATGKEITIVNSQNNEAIRRPPNAGTVQSLVLGEGESQVRVLDTPTVDTAISMVIRRLPLDKVDVRTETFEIRDEQTPHLIKGMQAWAFLKDDPDAYDKQRSDRALTAFLTEATKARVESGRANHVPGVVAYGGY